MLSVMLLVMVMAMVTDDDDGESADTDAREGGGVDQGYNRDGDDDA